MIKTIIFDLDGTLIDSEADLASAVNHSLKSIGQAEQSQKRITSFIGNGLRNLLTNVLGPGKEELYPKAAEAFRSFYLEHCTDKTTLYPGVKEFMEKYFGKMKMGVVTNKQQIFAEKIVKEFKLQPFISLIYGGDSLPKAKPHPQPLLEAVETLGGEPRAALMVGDGPQDLQAGKAAGMKTCVTRYGFGFHESLLDLQPDFVITQFQELDKIVSCLN